ncbi:AMP-binding protein [Nocardia sp. CDC160]|uniref:AMP-binding protein n=1 Tax=Nocardia sp. CDC160 TaxID=3112166 RepID=UPI002DB6E133|nr:AMP-binding protein [Nocardia sp. CDC160]MEC3913361.1 AMP-binding protein [Nocardia sp. CDC160]
MPEILSAVERHRLVDEWANGVELYDVPSVSMLIECGRRVPSLRTAVRCGGHILTYAELYERLDGGVTGTAGPTLDDLARVLCDIAAAAEFGAVLAELGPRGTGLKPVAVAAAADDRRAVAADQRACPIDRAYGSPDVRLLATRWDTTDAAVELLAALADGATLVLATAAQRADATALAELIATSAATHVVADAGTLAGLAYLPSPALPTVRRWDVFGNDCPAALSTLLRELAPGSCTGFACTTPEYAGVAARGPLDGSGRVRPIPGARLLVLDESLRLVPPGRSGRVYVGGSALALELDGLAEGFVDDPFVPGGRLVRTEQFGAWTTEGWLVLDMTESDAPARLSDSTDRSVETNFSGTDGYAAA